MGSMERESNLCRFFPRRMAWSARGAVDAGQWIRKYRLTLLFAATAVLVTPDVQ